MLSCRRVAAFGAWHVFIRIELLGVGDPRLQRKQRFSGTDKLNGICISEAGITSNGRLDGHPNRHVGKIMFRNEYCISDTHSTGLFPYYPLLTK